MSGMTNIVNRNKTSAQVGDALGVSSSTVARHAREGRIPFMETPGHHGFFPRPSRRFRRRRRCHQPAAMTTEARLGHPELALVHDRVTLSLVMTR